MSTPPQKVDINSEQLAIYREELTCSFEQIDTVFGDCMVDALARLSVHGIKDYLEGASLICMIGRGVEPVLDYLQEMPLVAERLGEGTLSLVSKTVWSMSRSPNGNSIPPFLQTVAESARRLGSERQFHTYVGLIMEMMERTTSSIHGFHTTIPSPGAPNLLVQMPYLLSQLSLEGLKNWIDYGVRAYPSHPDRQRDYFSLESPDSRAILQRERHGTLFIDNERRLELYMRALWDSQSHFVPYSEALDSARKPRPYYDEQGMRVPDLYDDKCQVPGIDRYRALLAHMAAHQRWSERIIADNFSPFQRLAIEMFEDSRVELLAIRNYPGLRKLWLALHPMPEEDACDDEQESCVRHRLAMTSYAILNPQHRYRNADLLEVVSKFQQLMIDSESSLSEITQLAVSYVARTRRQSDLQARVVFKDTVVNYRDDNRHLWLFIEEADEPDDAEFKRKKKGGRSELESLPPRHYKEWDYQSRSYRPDWVSLYESLHPPGNPLDIDELLEKHAVLAKRLEQILDRLKPQDYKRLRYQEEGSDLDLDMAIRALIDYKAGSNPDPRINMSHTHDGRDIAVTLLMDLSESVDQIPEGCEQSVLQLSREAVAILGWAIERLGDKFAIAGFSSNSRHEVRYQHIKGYSEPWDETVKGRLAAIKAGYSTRMGAAMRHAGHYLGSQMADKKLLLVLTDGEPSDIDVDDERLLIEDSHKAVQELDQRGIYTYCINLDPQADDYVEDIFGSRYAVIDRVERLPERLPRLFMALTK